MKVNTTCPEPTLVFFQIRKRVFVQVIRQKQTLFESLSMLSKGLVTVRPACVVRKSPGGRSTRVHALSGNDENKEQPKITREYREEDDTLNSLDQMVGGGNSSRETSQGTSSQYIDELPEIPRTEMSAAMKEKLRREYYSLGGSPTKSMGGNYFLNIILVISFLAILSAALGYL